MARRTFSCVCSVPESWRNQPKVERFFTRELAEYLHVSTIQLQKLARQRGIDRYVVIGFNRQRADRYMWVDRRGAAGLIAHFRAMQGDSLAQGRDWDVQRAKRQASYRRSAERQRSLRAAGASR